MKRLINSKNWVMVLVLMALSVSSAMADEDDFLLSVRNLTHTSTTIEFDLYLLDTDNTQTLEFAALQLGLLLNSSIYGSGTLTVTYSNAGSGLDGDQQFVNTPNVVAPLAGYDGKTLIRLMPNSIPPVPPGAGSGTVISSTGYGTLLAHFMIESSVSFTANSRAALEFCSGVAVSPLYPTILYSYINGDNTPLPVTPGSDAIVDGDPLLNATLPVIFNVTGGGTYCQGGDGLPIGLDGSELNTTYTLYRNSLEVSSLTGTGNPLSFGNQTAGIYTVIATNEAGDQQMDGTAELTAVINTVTPPSSTPTLCINTPLTAITHTTTGATGIGTATGLPGGVTAAWASNTITISGTPTSSGTFNYSIPLTGGCGSVNATGTITVTPAMTAGPASATPTLCINTPLTAITHTTTGATGIGTATGLPGGVTAAWASNTITISGTPTASGTFGYSIPLTGGCGTVSATGTITVNALPVTSAISGSATPPCNGSGQVYSVTATSGSSYLWTVPEGAVIASGQGTNSITVNFATTNGNITVTETNAATCTGSPVSLAISLQGCGLDANFVGDPEEICIGSSVIFTNTSTGTTGSTVYAWNFGAGASPATANTIGPHTVTYTTTGSKTVSLTITDGASDTETRTGYITVNPLNTVTLSSGVGSDNQTVCINAPITSITYATTGATGIGAAVNLPSGVTAVWASNTITISGTPTASGTFGYSIPLTGGCGTVSATGTITVTPAMTAGPASATPTLCINTPLTSITHITTGATGIGASVNLPSGVTAAWASNTITISGTPTASGTFGYSIPLTGGCGTVNATGTITVTPAMTASPASATPTLCINTPLTAITHITTGATGIGAAVNLPSGVTAAWASNTITISGTPTVSGTFGYSIPLTGGCGSVNATGTITVTPANTINLTSGVGTNNQTVCSGTAITNITYLTTGATGAAVTGLPTGVTGNWSSGVVTISGTPSATGNFGYTVTLTDGCGTVTATGTINVNALPVTSVITGSATPACNATGVSYSVTSTAGSTYTWTVPEGATIATGQGTSNITVNFGTTNGNITVTERNASGCYGLPVTLTISLQGCGLAADFSASPRIVCIGSSVLFTDLSTGTSGGTTYNWNFGSGASPLTASGPGPHSVTYSTAGSKDVTLTITEGASDTETKVGYITVNPANTIALTSPVGSNNQTVCINTSVTTITYSTSGATGATFSGFPSGLTMQWVANVVTISGNPSIAGTFNYTVTLTGGCGSISANGTINVSAVNTAGAPSSTPTLCINTPLTAITHTTTGATGIGIATGLPAGVTAAWASNSITISGTPTASGTFNYNIPLTGGCGNVNAAGTITVNALPSAAGPLTGPTAFTPGTSGIAYSVSPITSAASYLWSYSGTGVTINGAGNSVTLDFSASATPGTLSVFGRNSCGDGAASTLDLTAATKTLTLSSVLLEGLYNGSGTMREASNGFAPQYPGIADRIRVELHQDGNYSTIVYAASEVELSITGTATLTIPAEYSGNYYITIKHRNSIETTTATPLSFAGVAVNQSFATRTNVFGDNLKFSGDGYYLIYGADVNQDGIVDTGDMNDVDNGSAAILIGYNLPDANGDGLVDTSDMNMVDNNSAAIVYIRLPN